MSLVEELHAAHKARQRRIARAAASLQIKNSAESQPRELPHEQPTTVECILRAVACEFDIPVSDIIGSCTKQDCVIPRYMAIGLMVRLAGLSSYAIGRHLGRDHTAILKAKKRLNKRIDGDELFRRHFDQLAAEVAGA